MNSDIPKDAWAIRQEQWDAYNGEILVAPWHRTAQWIRRDGTVSGIVTVCNRVYHPQEVMLAGAQTGLQLWEPTCKGCFDFGNTDAHPRWKSPTPFSADELVDEE